MDQNCTCNLWCNLYSSFFEKQKENKNKEGVTPDILYDFSKLINCSANAKITIAREKEKATLHFPFETFAVQGLFTVSLVLFNAAFPLA